MIYDKQKLSRFKESVFKDVNLQIENMQKKILIYKNTEIESIKNKKLSEIFNFMQNEIQKLNFNYKNDRTKKKLEIKNEILKFRNNLIKNFYEKLKQKIITYTKTNDYENYLKKHIKIVCENLNFKVSTLLLSHSDFKFKEQILDFAKFNSVEIDKQNELGGFKIIISDKKILIDKTLKNILENEFKNFYQNHKLILNISEMG